MAAAMLDQAAWPDPTSLVSYDDILKAMDFYNTVEANVEQQLEAILSDAAALDGLLSQLDKLTPTLGRVETDVRDLATRVDNTAQVAQRISGQVRRLDEEQSRVKDSIDTLQAIQDLKNAIASISADMNKQDWESATRHMQRALAIDPKILESEFAQAVVPTSALPHPPAQTLQELADSMLATFLEEFKKASQARDETSTSRYFKLFPMINHQKEGLDAYADFVCGLVSSRQTRLHLSPGKQTATPHYFATFLTPLFEQIAVIIAQHQPVVEKYYGRPAMLSVISRLQGEADTQALTVLDSWREERRTDKLLSDTQAHKFNFLATLSAVPNFSQASSTLGLPSHLRALNASLRGTIGTQSQTDAAPPEEDEPIADPKQIDQAIGEVAAFSARWQLFRRFIHARLTMDEGEAPPSAVVSPEAAPETESDVSVADHSKFHKALQTSLDKVYVPLELWYLRIGLEKAHAIDEPDVAARPVVSSALDDAFFILKKVIGRVFATANATTVTTLCKAIRTSVERDFAHIMRRRIEAAATALNQMQGRGEERDRRERDARSLYLVYVNDLDLAGAYLNRLLANYTADHALQQAFHLEAERTQAQAALAHLKKAEDAIKTTVKAGMDQLFNQMVRPKIRPLILECYKDVSYALDEDAYADAEYNDQFCKRFFRSWAVLVEPFKGTLTDTNYATFFAMTVAVLVRPWEATIKGMRFTELGALRFDRDLRTVVSHLSEQTPFGTGPLREAFTRLQQIATLLSADADDINELVSTNGWRLATSEVNSFLALKTTS